MANVNTVRDSYAFNFPIGRLAFHHLFTPAVFNDKNGNPQKPKYQATVFFEDEVDFQEYKKAKERLKMLPDVAKMGEEWFKELKSPIRKERDPDKLEKYPFLKDKFQLTASSIFPPAVVDPSATLKYTKAEEGEIYRGCYGVLRASLGIHNKEKIFLQLIGFQKVRNGDPLGFVGASVDDFVPFTATESLAGDDDI